MQVLRGIGEINTLLKLELYKKPVLVAILGVTMFISPLAIAIGMCIYGIYTMVVNAFPNRKFINYHIKEQLKDVSGNAGLALCMFVCVYLIGQWNINPYVLISIQILMGALIYCGLSELLHLESWQYVKVTAKAYYTSFNNEK